MQKMAVKLKGWSVGVATVVALLAVATVSACDKLGAGKQEKAASNQAANATGPIKVGHFASMTGPEATFGQSTDQGIRLALEEINAAGGIKGRLIEVVTLDTGSKASEGGTAVTRLITETKVVAVLGEVASSISLAGAPVAQEYGVPMITPSSTNPKVTEVGDMIFRMCFMDDFQGAVQARFVKDELKFTKAAVLYDQAQAYSKGLAEYFEKAFVAAGGTIVTKQAYDKGNTDVSAQLQTIKGSGAEVIVMPGYYTDVGTIANQARKLGITAPFFGGDGWESPKLVEIGGAALEGSYYSNHYAVDEGRPEVAAFVSKFQAKYGQVPDSLAALGYDAMKLLAAAIERSPSLDGKALRDAIAATKDFAGVTGVLTFDAGRNATKAVAILQVKGGKTVFVKSIAPDAPAAAAAAAPAPAAPAPAPAAP